MTKRHQFMMYLHYVKYFYLDHLSPQISALKKYLESLDFLQNRGTKAQFTIENDELLTRISGLIYQGQKFFW